MIEAKRKAGRPRKAVKVENFPVVAYMPDEEAFSQVKEAAERQGISVSAWARNVLLREARRELDQ